jgi:NAD(P)H dehydrogenase (quinone)
MTNVKLAIIFYSSTGTNYQLAEWAAEGAKEAGAEVKILKVPELAPQSVIDSNPAWKHFAEEVAVCVPTVSLNELEWADAIFVRLGRNFSSPLGNQRPLTKKGEYK